MKNTTTTSPQIIEEEEKKEQQYIEPDSFQQVIEQAYDKLKQSYGLDPCFTGLFTVDEQMDMWDKINSEEGARAERLLSETMKHGN